MKGAYQMISVIVPVYNVEKYLERCINSIANQTYKDIEIILVNDGSTDGSLEICRKYAAADNRIQVIDKPNGGLSSARNAGIAVAKGEYIGFVDSDDYIRPDMYEKLYSRITAAEADIAVCGYRWVDEKGVDLPGYASIVEDEVCSKDEIFVKFTNNNYFYYVTAWNRLYKKRLFDSVKFPEGKLHEDEFTAHLFYDRCEKIACCKDRLYNYVQRADSIMSSVYSHTRLDALEAFIQRMEYFVSKGKYTEAEFWLNSMVFTLMVAENKLSEDKSKKKINSLKDRAYKLYLTLKEKNIITFKKKIKYVLFFSDNRLFKVYFKYKNKL